MIIRSFQYFHQIKSNLKWVLNKISVLVRVLKFCLFWPAVIYDLLILGFNFEWFISRALLSAINGLNVNLKYLFQKNRGEKIMSLISVFHHNSCGGIPTNLFFLIFQKQFLGFNKCNILRNCFLQGW